MDSNSPFAPSLQTDVLQSAHNNFWRETLSSFAQALTQSARGLLPAAWRANPLEAHDTAAKLGLDAKRVGDQAYIFLNRALRQAVWDLSLDARDLLEELEEDDLEKHITKLLSKQPLLIETGQLYLDPATFDKPQNSGLFLAVQRLSTAWLRALGMDVWAADAVTRRLPCYFFCALQEEWHTHALFYGSLQREAGMSPFFGRAAARGGRWGRYLAGLLQSIDTRMGDEPFGLREVYVPPLAYTEPSDESVSFAHSGHVPRRVVDLGKEILRWVYVPEKDDAVRFVAGGSGSGKTSFLTALAAELAGATLFPNEQKSRPGFPILFIPFAELQYQGNFQDALRHYLARHSLPESTLTPHLPGGERLLVIIDDLDTMPPVRGSRRRMLDEFYSQVGAWLKEVNAEEPRLQVLLAGDKAAWQEVPEALMRIKAMLWLMPFYVPVENRENYRDDNGLLNGDLREAWWRGYQGARGLKQDGLPKRLRAEAAQGLLHRPLDCRLAATAWVEKGDGIFERPDQARDHIYQAVLEKSYHRLVPVSREKSGALTLEEYSRLVAECAVLTWHSEDVVPGPGVNPDTLRRHAAATPYTNWLVQRLVEHTGPGMESFFRASFFQTQEGVLDGQGWKLTPEGFVEFLVAGRLAQTAERMLQLKADAARDPEQPRYEKRALALWGALAAVRPVEAGQGEALTRTLRRYGAARAEAIQGLFAELLGYTLRHGIHLEGWHALPSMQDVVCHSRHAEESILLMLNSAAEVTGKLSKVNWPHVDAPRTWLHRLQGGVESRNVPHAIKCLNRLDLGYGQLMGCDLIGASLVYSDLSRATLRGANLAEADLTGATLHSTDLCVADLAAAYLRGADLRDADLRGAILRAADLRGANLSGADLKGAVLDFANLEGANLTSADLAAASLNGTELEGATITGTILDEEFVALAEE
jgi:hypothetical protein